METQNQPVACQCSGVLKGITVACAVLAVVLPWFGMMAALIGILLAVVSIVCAIIAVCKKATMFGIIMNRRGHDCRRDSYRRVFVLRSQGFESR